MTTIGYGSFTPVTSAGKVAVILFGIVGIVVTGFLLAMLSSGVDHLVARSTACALRAWQDEAWHG